MLLPRRFKLSTAGMSCARRSHCSTLKLIKQVMQELESLKVKSLEAEQKVKLRNDSKERLRWTEGVMALLLRLGSLQGVHPEVRLIRKAVTKELIGFQETIDCMSTVCAESNDLDVVSHETVGSSAATPPEVAAEMETEDNVLRDILRDLASGGASENGSDGLNVKFIEDSTFEKHDPRDPLTSNDFIVHSVAPHCAENGCLAGESTIVEVGPPNASEILSEDPMDAENKEQQSMMHEDEIEPASSQSLPFVTGNQEAEVVDHVSQSGVHGVNPATPLDEKETTTMEMDGHIIPARIATQSIMALEPHRCEQDGKLQDNNTDAAPTDRSLLLQVLKENRKLKDTLAKVLEWGKLLSDAIHNLTHQVSQLEEQKPPSISNLLRREDRKRGHAVDNMELRCRRRLEKGRKIYRRHDRGYSDSEDWPSVESDDYFLWLFTELHVYTSSISSM